MWLALVHERNDDRAVELVLPQLEAIAQFTEEVRRRMACDGVDGLEGTLEVYRRLRHVLDGVESAELARMRAALDGLARRLEDLARSYERLVFLKRALGV